MVGGEKGPKIFFFLLDHLPDQSVVGLHGQQGWCKGCTRADGRGHGWGIKDCSRHTSARPKRPCECTQGIPAMQRCSEGLVQTQLSSLSCSSRRGCSSWKSPSGAEELYPAAGREPRVAGSRPAADVSGGCEHLQRLGCLEPCLLCWPPFMMIRKGWKIFTLTDCEQLFL